MRIQNTYTIALFYVLSLAYFTPGDLYSQETNSHIAGIIKSPKNEFVANATIIAIHEPTRNTFVTKTNAAGCFYLFNLRPGGPYTLTVSHSGYESIVETNLFFKYSQAQSDNLIELTLKENALTLQEVIINSNKNASVMPGTETNINQYQIASLPSISRNLQDFVRVVPQSKVNGDGMMSLAGQNNKYNAFFIDGSNNNDMLGTALSGTNSGQTGSPPISIEALEEIKILLSPYDVQYSNFTGGSINAITRSGSNEFKSSAWYFFRNEQMAGRSAIPEERPGSPGVFERLKLSSFTNQTAGIWASGPINKNKLFYFLLLEKQKEQQPQPFAFSQYRGNSTVQQIFALADTLRRRYNYDPGSFLDLNNNLDANRFMLKFDWNLSAKNKLVLSYRYNYADRGSPGTTGSTSIRFSNNGFSVPTTTHSASVEWKSFFNATSNNRLLLSFTNQQNNREISGQPFPAIRITDGAGVINLGSNSGSQINLFKGSEFNLSDIFRIVKKKNVFTTGVDITFSKLNDLIIPNYFGLYEYRNLNDFLSNAFPFRFQRTVSLVDKPTNDDSKAGSIFNTSRIGTFINDEIQVNPRFRITAGLRIDGNSLPRPFKTDPFFDTIAKAAIENYYDLEGAMPSTTMKTHWQLSPRLGFSYKMPGRKLTIRGGAGIFTGHILNLWYSEIYNVNTSSFEINPLLYALRFNPDPFNQPDLQSLGINPERAKGAISLVARNFKYPTIFRTSFGADKKLNNGWNFTTEVIFTKNIHEGRYTNVNILPADKSTAGPGSRNVFSLNTSTELIPMSGGNPYTSILLLSNNKKQRGFSYNLTAVINKVISDKLDIACSYSYGNATALFEPTGTSSGNAGQWGAMETAQGRNNTLRSVSDFAPGHIIKASVTRKFLYPKKRASTLFTLFYTGQSGSPFSYVYGGSIANDNGRNSSYDLIYIPAATELEYMLFLPNTVNSITYTPQEQKTALNNFIETDKYLRKHRGQFASRNGARVPFSQVVDLRIQQNFILKSKKKTIEVSIIYDVFNFTNMLSKNWGRIYFMSADNFALIRFAGFSNTTTLTPQYQFTPFTGKPWSINSSTAPGSSARWISQLGIRINL